ncbi:MAG: hypothetical protein HGA39_03815 [Coriobacteriia bacterium]|nr:hypothetical protein [Coriobacteriia bacterium]
MKSTRFVCALAVCGLLLGALGLAGCKSAESDVAARVDGQVVTETELNTQLDQLKKQYPDMFSGTDSATVTLEYRQTLLDSMIDEILLAKAAKDAKITVSADEVQAQLDQLKSGFSDPTQFDAALKSAGFTLATLKAKIESQLTTQKLIDSLSPGTNVSDVEVQDYYDKHKTDYYQKAAKRASHILFKPEDKATAEKILAQLKAGGDFAALAKQYSIDTASAVNGGDLGWPTAPYVTEFQAGLDKLGKGQMSGLVESPYGWHIILVTDTREASQQPLSAVRTQIEQTILAQRRTDAYQNFLAGLRKKATIEIVDAELKAAAEKASSSTTATAQ